MKLYIAIFGAYDMERMFFSVAKKYGLRFNINLYPPVPEAEVVSYRHGVEVDEATIITADSEKLDRILNATAPNTFGCRLYESL